MRSSLALTAVAAALLPSASRGSFPLDENILQLSHTAVQLSALAYETNLTQWATGTNGTFSHPDYDEIIFYTEEPDQAVLAAVDNECFVAFRGTKPNFADCELAFGWLRVAQCGQQTRGSSAAAMA